MCERIRIGNSSAIVCRGRKAKACLYCGCASNILCDYPIAKRKNGKFKTCDAPMCTDCAQSGISDDVHFCRNHYPIAKAAYERRLAKAAMETVH